MHFMLLLDSWKACDHIDYDNPQLLMESNKGDLSPIILGMNII